VKSALLSAKFRIGASLLTTCIASLAFTLLSPSRSFLYRLKNPSNVLAPSPEKTRTYREGSRVYLDNGTVKVGLETAWGGAIAEIVWHGMNFVNDYDAGREIQVALYDGDPYPGCDNCTGADGWDPVQGGDVHKHGSPLLAENAGQDSIYTKTQPHHWKPDNKQGGPDKPIPSDVFIEQWVSFLPDTSTGIKVHYKITHFGKDLHTNAFQEFPAVYVNSGFDRFVYYGGEVPWTNAPVSFYTMPVQPKTSPPLYAPEDWGGFVNDDNIGLLVFVPGQYPYVGGFRTLPEARKKFATNYFFPRVPFSFGPNSVLEGDAYVFVGDYRQSRHAIYSLHRSLPQRDIFPAYGFTDSPKRDSKASGPLPVSGWAFEDTQVLEVEILVDEHFVGRANYGVSRPDISKVWSHAPSAIGFSYTLDTSKYSNGKHLVGVNAKDPADNVAIFPRIPIVIDNPKSTPP
jgi:hypothetical protein